MATKRLSFIITTLEATLCLLLLAMTLRCASSARILLVEDNIASPPTRPIPHPMAPRTPPVTDAVPASVNHAASPPEPPIPADAPLLPRTPPVADLVPVAPDHKLTVINTPVASTGDLTLLIPNPAVQPLDDATTQSTPTPTESPPAGSVAMSSTVADVGIADHPKPSLSFFMHDLLGWSTPSSTGIEATSAVSNGQFPISESNESGVELPISTSNLNNKYNGGPYLTRTTNAVTQGNGDMDGTIDKETMYSQQKPAIIGRMTVINEELRGGQDEGSTHVMGKAQGFYLANLEDGSSQTISFTAMFIKDGGDEVLDTISFFGVQHANVQESEIAVVGGTGKYENAKGFVTIQQSTLHQETQQHTIGNGAGGVESLLQFNVHITH